MPWSGGCHLRRKRSFERSFSLFSRPPNALDLRLCSETAQGRGELTTTNMVFMWFPYGCPLGFQWFSGFPIISVAFHVVICFSGFSLVFILFSCGVPMISYSRVACWKWKCDVAQTGKQTNETASIRSKRTCLMENPDGETLRMPCSKTLTRCLA